MQQRRAGAGATVSNGKIYVAGGFDDNAPLSSVEVYDPKAKMWHNIRQMTSPRGGVGLSPLSGNLVAVGGHNGSEYLRSVEIYSILHDTWIKVIYIKCEIYSDLFVRALKQNEHEQEVE